MKTILSFAVALLGFAPMLAHAETLTLAPQPITEWKAVYGVVETRDKVPARARVAGTIVALDVSEGDLVKAGQRVALIKDDKLAFQLAAMDSQIGTLKPRLKTAQTDLERGEELIKRGVITKQRFEQLASQVDVLLGEINTIESKQAVIKQQVSEGEVVAPEDGVVLSVPTSKGAVANPGESIAVIGGGGTFLRLSIPERHSDSLVAGEAIEIGEGKTGQLIKVYPQIEGGRVLADVEVADLDERFIGRRVPVRLPVGTRQALLVPETAVKIHGGIDFVTVNNGDQPVRRAVVLGATVNRDGQVLHEVLTGLVAGDQVVTGHE
ncbi:MAG: efflux transporter periplasmic adaptor subunit [Rhodobacterales bacterium]|nr:MAG: efflux transporter periplasmic adaptor subunit [Rhodobacterales bacterium]